MDLTKKELIEYIKSLPVEYFSYTGSVTKPIDTVYGITQNISGNMINRSVYSSPQEIEFTIRGKMR